ncbi:hypothetical protein SLA2020_213200 [Shorea laevis]
MALSVGDLLPINSQSGHLVNMEKEYRPLDITLISAKDLKDVNLFSKMDVYAVVTINGDPQTKQQTPVDRNCGRNPNWQYTMIFTVEEAAANQNRLNLVIRLVSYRRRLGDEHIGQVVVPVKEFLDCKEKDFVCEVRLRNGKLKGTLNLCSKIGQKFSVPVAAPPHVAEEGKSAEKPVMGYPAAGSSAGWPPPRPAAYPYNYPPQGAHPPPQPQESSGYPAPHAQGYGYTCHPPYGEHGYMPAQQPAAGLGLRLVGGLFAREVIDGVLFGGSDDAGVTGGLDGVVGFDF